MTKWPTMGRIVVIGALTLSCQRQSESRIGDDGVVGQQNGSNGAAPNGAGGRLSLAVSEPILDVRAEGGTADLTFRFRTRDVVSGETKMSTPRVSRIFVGPPGGRNGDCVVDGDPPLRMSSWRYGDTPTGFVKTGCGPLAPGQYVVSVRAVGSVGGIRIAVGTDGTVVGLPMRGSTEPVWDGR